MNLVFINEQETPSFYVLELLNMLTSLPMGSLIIEPVLVGPGVKDPCHGLKTILHMFLP